MVKKTKYFLNCGNINTPQAKYAITSLESSTIPKNNLLVQKRQKQNYVRD